jgi:hypothetical protein
MISRTPRNANEFIEQQLDERLQILDGSFDSDMLSLSGPLVFGVDDIIRDAIEGVRQHSQDRQKLTVILTTSGGYIEVVHRFVDTMRYHLPERRCPND